MALAHDQAYELKKSLWTEEDFDSMGWHDVRIVEESASIASRMTAQRAINILQGIVADSSVLPLSPLLGFIAALPTDG